MESSYILIVQWNVPLFLASSSLPIVLVYCKGIDLLHYLVYHHVLQIVQVI